MTPSAGPEAVGDVPRNRWLTGPAAIAPMLLELPTRMRAMGLVFVLAPMVWDWWQYEMALEHFAGLHAALARLGDGAWQRVRVQLRPGALAVLAALQIPPQVYWTPRSRCPGVPGG